MTIEKAIEKLTYARQNADEELDSDWCASLDMAIKALEQESILDKIRAEIVDLMPPLGDWMYEEGHIEEQTACEVISDVLHIIDKYKAESEG